MVMENQELSYIFKGKYTSILAGNGRRKRSEREKNQKNRKEDDRAHNSPWIHGKSVE